MNSARNITIFCILSVVIGMVIAPYIMPTGDIKNPLLLFGEFARNGYYFNHNYVNPAVVHKVSFQKYLYFLFFIGVILFLCLNIILRRRVFNAYRTMLHLGIILFILTSMVQIFNFYAYYLSERDAFYGRSLLESNLEINRTPHKRLTFEYSLFCHQHIKGPARAKFISDMDINRDPYMLMHRMMAYYLYPIDIRHVHPGEPEYLLFFLKKDPEQAVPADYEIIARQGTNFLIARKKQ